MQFVQPYSNFEKSESTVIITEITDEEDININNQDEMLVEDDK